MQNLSLVFCSTEISLVNQKKQACEIWYGDRA